MVCPKLEKGTCKVTKNKCKKSYLVKMILWTKCLVFKKSKLMKQQPVTKKHVKHKVTKKATTKKKVSKRRK